MGIIAIILAALVAIAMLTGVGGSHGPSRHALSGAAQSPESPAVSSLDPVSPGGR